MTICVNNFYDIRNVMILTLFLFTLTFLMNDCTAKKTAETICEVRIICQIQNIQNAHRIKFKIEF